MNTNEETQFNLPSFQEDSSSDQRYLPRWKVSNPMQYARMGESIVQEGETVDLSCSGMCFRSSDILIPGTSLAMTVFLNKTRSIILQGDVVWNRIERGKRLVGVEFQKPSIEDQEMILNYAFEVDPDNLVEHWFSGWESE